VRPFDVLLALTVAAAQVGGSYLSSSWHTPVQHPGIWTYIVLVTGATSLVLRRRYPVGVLAFVLATTFAAGAMMSHGGPVWFALIVAFFNAVLARRRAAAIASLAIGYAASMFLPWLAAPGKWPSAGFAMGLAAFLLLLLSVAELVRMREQRAVAVAGGRAEETRRQAGEERMRMARELHDLVAHNISVINVQANTALHLMDRQPDRARTALSTINEVSKQALVELRSVLGVLRQVDEDLPRAPAPSLERIGELIDRAGDCGLTVRLEVAGTLAALPANVDLAAYRIVQEALTNCAKHAGGSRATVRVTFAVSEVALQVSDDGPAQQPEPRASEPGPRATGLGPHTTEPARVSGGNGLAGMRERAHAVGGTLLAGRRPEGGFQVRAWLPFGTSPDAEAGTVAEARTTADAGAAAEASPSLNGEHVTGEAS
jgi:signal transduction histidine kinase